MLSSTGMKSPFVIRLIASSAIAATALSPLTAFAATPQTALNTALLRLSDQKTVHANLEANITVNERALAKDGRSSLVDMGFRANIRTVQAADGKLDGEGAFELMRLSSETKAGDWNESWKLDSPFRLDWAGRDNMSYVRFQSLPNSLVELARNEGDVDLTQIIGMWIGFETSRDALADELGSRYENLIAPAETANADLLKRYPPVQVVRVEKRWKTNGDSIMRLRARINPNLVNALQRKEVAEEIALSRKLGETLAQRNKRVAEINTRYAELRRALAGVGLAVHLNETQGRIDRMEVGGKFSLPQKIAGKTTSIVDAKFSIGMNFLPLDTRAVEHPAYWRPFEEVLRMLEPKRPEPVILEPAEESVEIPF